MFQGCGGNQNNFESKDSCITTCAEDQVNGSLAQNQGKYYTLHNY